MSEPLTPDNPWAAQLLQAERENHCGDAACQTRRTSAAVRVLTGAKEHQDYCWAIETFEVELGLRDPATVGSEPSAAALDSARTGASEGLREALKGSQSVMETALRASVLPEGLRSVFVAHYAEVRIALAAARSTNEGLDVERLVKALMLVHSWDNYTAVVEARVVAREYAALSQSEEKEP